MQQRGIRLRESFMSDGRSLLSRKKSSSGARMRRLKTLPGNESRFPGEKRVKN